MAAPPSADAQVTVSGWLVRPVMAGTPPLLPGYHLLVDGRIAVTAVDRQRLGRILGGDDVASPRVYSIETVWSSLIFLVALA
jgi:hypothetical protein